MQTNDVWIDISFRKGATVHWTHIPFTRIGREIATLLPKPDYENNIRQAALRIQKQGLVCITLRKAAGDTELLWTEKV